MGPNTVPDGVKRWMAQVRKACYAEVQSGVRDGTAPINATDAAGYTALMRCCVSGQLLEVLLSCADCDVNLSHATDGLTALLLAARHRSARTVHALLRRGASFTRDALGCSALHKAAANSDPAVVRLLLHAQCDPCARDRDGRCALATAMLHGNEATALALLSWQQSWAAKGVLRAVSAETGRCDDDAAAAAGARSAGSVPFELDGLPDDCLELILQQLNVRSECCSDRQVAEKGRDCHRLGCGSIDGGAIVASVAASVVASSESATCGPRSGRALAHLARHVPAMACVCSRFRAVCRRRAVSAWLAVEGVNSSFPCYHPRTQYTTLLHVAAAEGMEEVVELLLRRGAWPLALDSCRRTPLQVVGCCRASLIAKLVTAQELALADGEARRKASDG